VGGDENNVLLTIAHATASTYSYICRFPDTFITNKIRYAASLSVYGNHSHQQHTHRRQQHDKRATPLDEFLIFEHIETEPATITTGDTFRELEDSP
jgi:hypothetical protein